MRKKNDYNFREREDKKRSTLKFLTAAHHGCDPCDNTFGGRKQVIWPDNGTSTEILETDTTDTV